MTCVEIASCHPAKIGGFFGCKINVFACENDVAHSVFFVFFAKSKNVDFCQIYVGKRASKVNISSNFPECVRIFPENVRETPPEIPNFGGGRNFVYKINVFACEFDVARACFQKSKFCQKY